MLVTTPIVSYFTPFYIASVYMFLYYTIYRFLCNLGIGKPAPQLQPIPSEEQTTSFVSEPVLQAVDHVTEKDELQSLPEENADEEFMPAPYNHPLWPSPRPVNFVQAIIQAEPEIKLYNYRLTHSRAVDILAQRGYMSRREFLRTNPLSYSERYMKGLNALYLLKGSIDKLENMLHEECYRQELRRIENGRCACPSY
jgi:hypothetical protein